MKHSHFFKQDYGYTTTFSLADLGAQFYEQRFNIAPLDIPTRGAGKDQFESALALPPHAVIVPLSGTVLVRAMHRADGRPSPCHLARRRAMAAH